MEKELTSLANAVEGLGMGYAMVAINREYFASYPKLIMKTFVL